MKDNEDVQMIQELRIRAALSILNDIKPLTVGTKAIRDALTMPAEKLRACFDEFYVYRPTFGPGAPGNDGDKAKDTDKEPLTKFRLAFERNKSLGICYFSAQEGERPKVIALAVVTAKEQEDLMHLLSYCYETGVEHGRMMQEKSSENVSHDDTLEKEPKQKPPEQGLVEMAEAIANGDGLTPEQLKMVAFWIGIEAEGRSAKEIADDIRAYFLKAVDHHRKQAKMHTDSMSSKIF